MSLFSVAENLARQASGFNELAYALSANFGLMRSGCLLLRYGYVRQFRGYCLQFTGDWENSCGRKQFETSASFAIKLLKELCWASTTMLPLTWYLFGSEQSSTSPAAVSPSGSFSRRRTSFLPSQKAVLRSSSSISGRANGFNVFYVPKVANGPAVGRTGIRCDATVAEKETPVEKYEYQAEVNFLTCSC